MPVISLRWSHRERPAFQINIDMLFAIVAKYINSDFIRQMGLQMIYVALPTMN